MKKIIIFIVALFVVAIVAPKFIGSIVETEHQAMINELNEQAIQVKETTFTRHWFGGTASTKIIAHLNNADIDDVELTVNEKLSFGPIIFADDGLHFGLSYSEMKLVIENNDEANEFFDNNLQLSWLLSFTHNIENNLTLNEYVIENDYHKLVLHPASAKFTLAGDKHLYGVMNWQGFEITGNKNIILDTVSVNIDQQLIRGSYIQGDAVTVGDFSLVLAALQLKDVNKKAIIDLENIKLNASAKEINETLMIALNYHIDAIKVAEQSFEHANLDLQFEHLDIETMQAISKIASTINNASVQSQAIINELRQLAGQLITKDPRLTIKDLSVLTPDGKIEITAEAKFDQNTFDQSKMMQTVVMALKLNAQAAAPVDFFAEGMKKNMIDMYKQQGLIIQEGELFKSTITFNNGKLTVNGKVIPM